MRSLMTLVALAGATSMAAAQSTIYFSDFEADGGGWTPSGITGDWERGTPTGVTGTSLGGSGGAEPIGGFSGDFVWGTRIGGLHGRSADENLTQTFDFTGLTDVTLSFYEYIDTGSSSFDMASVIVNGNQEYLSSGSSAFDWREVVLDLSAYDGQAGVEINFNLLTTAVVERMGWYIDDVRITAIPTPGAMALLGLGGLVASRRRR